MIKKKGAIFDMDGTLLDSMWVWRQIDVDFLGRRGFEVPPDYLEMISNLLTEKVSGRALPEPGCRVYD